MLSTQAHVSLTHTHTHTCTHTHTHTHSEQAIEVGVSVADEPTTLYLQGTVQGATPILQAMWRWTRGMSSIVADVGLLELSGNVMVYEGSRLADVATSLEGITQVSHTHCTRST